MKKKLIMFDYSNSSQNSILLSPSDNVCVVTLLAGVKTGGAIHFSNAAPIIYANSDVPNGHKVALRKIEKGEAVIKFGCVIGVASKSISPGDHVHIENVCMPPQSEVGDHISKVPVVPFYNSNDLPKHFLGYKRDNGTAGVRNYIVVVASVNCSATVVKAICRHFLSRDLKQKGIDGVIPVTDPAGCTQEIGGPAHTLLNRTLSGWIFHPNVVGALVVGLGCEGTTYESILKISSKRPHTNIPLEHLRIQDVGGTAKAIREGVLRIEKILEILPTFQRTEIDVSHLTLALNCGGSDAFSAITANPALGYTSDIIVSHGGTVALAEIPECHGAEGILFERACSKDSKEKLKSIFQWWDAYSKRQNITLNNNLAVGNISGGITTIIEKSIGAMAKGGSTPLREVVDYAESITESGFVLMNTPGYDPVSVTGLVAGGCNLVAFTTGRGSVYGCAIAPTVKIATTSELFERLQGDMDVNAGTALKGMDLSEVGKSIYRFLIDVASGKQTCSEELGLGWEEFIPWSLGETL